MDVSEKKLCRKRLLKMFKMLLRQDEVLMG